MLFVRQFGGVGKGGLNVLRPQRGVTSEDFILRRALCKIIEDHGNRDSRPASAEIATANSRITAQVLLPARHLTIVSRSAVSQRWITPLPFGANSEILQPFVRLTVGSFVRRGDVSPCASSRMHKVVDLQFGRVGVWGTRRRAAL